MAKGGYQIISFGKTPFTNGTNTKVPGVYESLLNNKGKPALISDIVLDGTEATPFYCQVTRRGDDFFMAPIAINANTFGEMKASPDGSVTYYSVPFSA